MATDKDRERKRKYYERKIIREGGVYTPIRNKRKDGESVQPVRIIEIAPKTIAALEEILLKKG